MINSMKTWFSTDLDLGKKNHNIVLKIENNKKNFKKIYFTCLFLDKLLK